MGLEHRETAKDCTDIFKESQGGGINGRTRKVLAELSKRPGQAVVTEESRSEIISHRF